MTTGGKKVLVTGGAGFIGSHTVVALHEAGYVPVVVDDFSNSEPSVMDRLGEILGQAVVCHRVDCTDRAALQAVFQAEGEIAALIHFAAFKAVGESVREPLKYYRNNLGGLLTCLELMGEFGVSDLVFSSSCTVYGQPDPLPVTEASPLKPAESPYGATKQISEGILLHAVAAGVTLRAMILRYFNPIGAHESARIGELPLGVPNNLVPFITQTAAGIREQLTVFGDDYETPDGSCIRDYIHVMDLAEAHVAALSWLERQPGEALCEALNVGTGAGHSVFEVIGAFEEASGETLRRVVGPRRPGDIPAIYADVTRSEEVLGWRARRTLGQAMADAWRWQQALARRG